MAQGTVWADNRLDRCVVMQVTFQGNTGLGGAFYLKECTATMTGQSTFLDNSGKIGAVDAFLSTLDILGPVCAQNNVGATSGYGFLFSERSKVTFKQPATA
jgi:hypothetical protein